MQVKQHNHVKWMEKKQQKLGYLGMACDLGLEMEPMNELTYVWVKFTIFVHQFLESLLLFLRFGNLLAKISDFFCYYRENWQIQSRTHRLQNGLIFIEPLDCIGMCFQIVLQMFDLKTETTKIMSNFYVQILNFQFHFSTKITKLTVCL